MVAMDDTAANWVSQNHKAAASRIVALCVHPWYAKSDRLKCRTELNALNAAKSRKYKDEKRRTVHVQLIFLAWFRRLRLPYSAIP